MNVYQVITDRILQSLADGVVPWRKPWGTATPKNLVSGREYRGVNVFLLGAAPFESPWWLTFNQARSLGGTVMKGERGTPVVFWKPIEQGSMATRPEEDGAERDRWFVLRYFTVFNVAQCQGIEAPPSVAERAFDSIEQCERIVAGFEGRPRIVLGGSGACYVPALDEVRMPVREAFSSPPEYYSTLFHELSHSTGAAHRLARKGVIDRARFGSHDYSQEELVAECGAAFLCAEAGIENRTLDNSAAYIASWSKVLKSEPRWIVHAAAQAAKAADLILGRASKSERETPAEAA
jgi:antirestriction protein ArdC